jgi:uncharacterized RDD family membrane protein YckC
MSTNNFLFNFSVKNEDVTQQVYATSTRRSLAVAIDCIIVLFLRAFFLQIINNIFFQKLIYKFLNDFEANFGTREPKGTPEHVQFVMHHSIFIYTIILIFLTILIGAIYHAYFNSSSWQATIGKRIAKVITTNNNSEKISFINGIYHYFLTLIPIIFIIIAFIYSQKNGFTIFEAFAKNHTLTIFGLLVLIATHTGPFNKKKINFFDYLMKFEFHCGRTESKMPWTKINK